MGLHSFINVTEGNSRFVFQVFLLKCSLNETECVEVSGAAELGVGALMNWTVCVFFSVFHCSSGGWSGGGVDHHVAVPPTDPSTGPDRCGAAGSCLTVTRCFQSSWQLQSALSCSEGDNTTQETTGVFSGWGGKPRIYSVLHLNSLNRRWTHRPSKMVECKVHVCFSSFNLWIKIKSFKVHHIHVINFHKPQAEVGLPGASGFRCAFQSESDNLIVCR